MRCEEVGKISARKDRVASVISESGKLRDTVVNVIQTDSCILTNSPVFWSFIAPLLEVLHTSKFWVLQSFWISLILCYPWGWNNCNLLRSAKLVTTHSSTFQLSKYCCSPFPLGSLCLYRLMTLWKFMLLPFSWYLKENGSKPGYLVCHV